MATASSKVIQRIDVHHKCSNINGISWSQDNRLAVLTNSFVTIIVSFVVTILGIVHISRTSSVKPGCH